MPAAFVRYRHARYGTARLNRPWASLNCSPMVPALRSACTATDHRVTHNSWHSHMLLTGPWLPGRNPLRLPWKLFSNSPPSCVGALRALLSCAAGDPVRPAVTAQQRRTAARQPVQLSRRTAVPTREYCTTSVRPKCTLMVFSLNTPSFPDVMTICGKAAAGARKKGTRSKGLGPSLGRKVQPRVTGSATAHRQ